MKKRIGLARAIVADPEIVLYDEPTTGLDPIRAQIINELIIKMHSQMKITSIIVTHDLKSACQVGNRIAFLHQGKIFFSAPPAEFIKTHHPLVRKFIEGKDKY
jgi:phospholipid/cholesterol/gamma-HCH transport system ATP-binding protein